MSFWTKLTSTERTSLAVAALGALLFAFLLWDDSWLVNRRGAASTAPLGHLASGKNDLRHKAAGSFGWVDADDRQALRVGDSLFSGSGSSAEIVLDEGGRIGLGENSLIVFNEVEMRKIADLRDGSFKIQVHGEVRVAINGQITKIGGNNSELQIESSPGKKPSIRILKGEATVQKGRAPALKLDARVSTVTRELPDEQAPATNPVVAQPPVAALVQPPPYAWKLDDYYTLEGARLLERDPPARLRHPVRITWTFEGGRTTPAFIQHTNANTFEGALAETVHDSSFEISEPFRGRNSWRVSTDRENWSDPATFVVETTHRPLAPRFEQKEIRRYFANPALSLAFPLTVEPGVERIVVQAGLSADFATGETRTFLSDRPLLSLAFYRPGIYHYRFRAVNAKDELSEWSETAVFRIEESPELPAPRFTRALYETELGQSVRLDWSAVPEAKGSHFALYTDQGVLVRSFETRRLGVGFKVSQPGRYRAVLQSLNELGRIGRATQTADVVVRAPAPPPAPTAPARLAQKPERAPAQEQTSSPDAATTQRARIAVPRPLNASYRESRLSLEGAAYAMQSSQQFFDGTQAPVAIGIGLRSKHWFDDDGIEVAFKSGLLGANTAGSALSPKQLEARYHRRHRGGFPLGLARELQTSLFAGVELYRSAGGSFSPQYDLLKFGTALEFPVAQRWSTGGEILLGFGTDRSRKYEISGHLGFFRSREWSAGVGYRLHLFEAGSARASPGELPFREGYTEGYSTLQFHY